jgi:hypothetical protein
MQFRRSVSALLMITLLSSCNVALSNNLPANPDLQPVPGTSRNETVADQPQGDSAERSTSTAHPSSVEDQPPPLVESYLLQGKLQDGETALLAELKKHGSDDQSRFGLGVLQFLRAFERLMQDLHHYGLRDLSTRGLAVRFVRVPAPSNRSPETLTYLQARKIADTFLKNLAQAEATLSSITDANVKLPLHFAMIRLDLNGDGRLGEDESLWKVYAGLSGNTSIRDTTAKDFLITFDRGDGHWLRGYCHLLMSMCEMYLAHDTKELFDCTAHLLFAKVQSPYGFLSKGKHVHGVGSDHLDVVDLIAFIHLINCPVVEPKRMESALHHLEATVAQSKETWKWIMAETDDDHEWLPNPRQTGVIPNVRVTDEMVSAWSDMMDEAKKLLAGETLIPFWRGDDGSGVNLRKVFMEPRTFDLVLWVQGTAAAPYLEKGEMTKSEIWRRLPRTFGSQFPGFALWFN